MQNYNGVIGSKESSKHVIVGKDTVYVHSNVITISEEEDLYQYDEIQYTKDEYIKLLSEKNDCVLNKTYTMQDVIDFMLFNLNNMEV